MASRLVMQVGWGPKPGRIANWTSWLSDGIGWALINGQRHWLCSLLGHCHLQDVVHQDLNTGCCKPYSCSYLLWSPVVPQRSWEETYEDLPGSMMLGKLGVNLWISTSCRTRTALQVVQCACLRVGLSAQSETAPLILLMGSFLMSVVRRVLQTHA